MTYDELKWLTNNAWYAFYKVFKESGVDIIALDTAMDRKDCFNDVDDAIMSVVKLEAEE